MEHIIVYTKECSSFQNSIQLVKILMFKCYLLTISGYLIWNRFSTVLHWHQRRFPGQDKKFRHTVGI